MIWSQFHRMGGERARLAARRQERRGWEVSRGVRGRTRGGAAVFAAALGVLAFLALAARAIAGGPVDLNGATASELAALPGIGEAKAQAIVNYREATPFRSVDDLRQVKGIGDRLLEQLRPHVSVSGAAPETGAGARTGAGVRAGEVRANPAPGGARPASDAAAASARRPGS